MSSVSSTLTPSSSSDFSSFSGFASSSSTFASEVATTTVANDDGGDGMPSVSRSSSLLFGFLITFLALFVGFMACGYSSRRAAQIRGARYVALLREIDGHPPVRMKRPRLWDVWVDDPVREDRWKDITPLSVSYIRPGGEKKPPSPSPASAQAPANSPPRETFPRQEYLSPFIVGSRAFGRFSTPLPPPSPSRPHPRRSPRAGPDSSGGNSNTSTPSRLAPLLPSRLRSLYRNHDRGPGGCDTPSARHKEAEEDTKDVQAQISVIIAMPSPSSPSRLSKSGNGDGVFEESRREELGDYEIGVARIPLARSAGQSSS